MRARPAARLRRWEERCGRVKFFSFCDYCDECDYCESCDRRPVIEARGGRTDDVAGRSELGGKGRRTEVAGKGGQGLGDA
ncbi:hypothetical protein [Streptomyces sp. NPDC058476]|uniref:hypothetical protein n=1 Tax=Streptomyces sp. NPDC058476 TaxID=3346519 RepID=UPI003648B6A5